MLATSRRSLSSTLALLCLFVALQLGPLINFAMAQDYIAQTGDPKFAVEAPVELGFVNLANGNLHLEIPLGSFPQRGGQPFAASLVYDSRIWGPVSGVWTPASNGGWRFATNADYGRRGGYTLTRYSCAGPHGGSKTKYSNFGWIFPDGSSKAFTSFVTWYYDANCKLDFPNGDTPSGGGTADDASGYFMQVVGYYSPTIYAPDGTQVNTDSCCSLVNPKDTNGNYITRVSANDTTLIDTSGRKPIVVTANCNGNSSQTCYDILNSQGTTYRVTTLAISL